MLGAGPAMGLGSGRKPTPLTNRPPNEEPDMKLFTALAASLLLTVACAGTDVHGGTDSDVAVGTEADLSCCAQSIMDNKKECCGESLEGKQVCPVTGQISE